GGGVGDHVAHAGEELGEGDFVGDVRHRRGVRHQGGDAAAENADGEVANDALHYFLDPDEGIRAQGAAGLDAAQAALESLMEGAAHAGLDGPGEPLVTEHAAPFAQGGDVGEPEIDLLPVGEEDGQRVDVVRRGGVGDALTGERGGAAGVLDAAA